MGGGKDDIGLPLYQPRLESSLTCRPSCGDEDTAEEGEWNQANAVGQEDNWREVGRRRGGKGRGGGGGRGGGRGRGRGRGGGEGEGKGKGRGGGGGREGEGEESGWVHCALKRSM